MMHQKGAPVSSTLHIFFKGINHTEEGSQYAELIQNREFEEANIPPGITLVNDFIVPPERRALLCQGTQKATGRWNGRLKLTFRPEITKLPVSQDTNQSSPLRAVSLHCSPVIQQSEI
jgi:hypothetical protein